MRACFAWSGAFAFIVLTTAAAAAAPLEAYGNLPRIDNVALSPDGTKLAFATTAGADREVLVIDLATHKGIAGVKITEQKLRDVQWAGNDHILVTASQTASARFVLSSHGEYFMTQSLDLNTHKIKLLLDDYQNAMNVVEGRPEPRLVGGQEIVFVQGVYFPVSEGWPALFSVNLESGSTRLLRFNSPDALDWQIDSAGVPYAEEDYSERAQHWSLRLSIDREWKEVFGVDAAIDQPYVYGLSDDGGALIVALPGSDGERDLRPVSLATGEMGPSVKDKYEFTDPILDPSTERIIGGVRVGVNSKYTFFDPTDQVLWNSLVHQFPGEEVELESMSDDRKMVVVHVSGEADGDSYKLVNMLLLRADTIGQAYAGIGPDDVAPVQAISYNAADGREIFAYLTLPRGREAKNLPLVVLPHGGPAVRDDPGFDWWSQALAAQGYAVLQPQYRGSAGFGHELLAAGFGQWGRKMQTDLSDGVRDLAKKGTIDPARVCIVGASYGGYAALAGATLDPGVYRCAVSVSGLSDLPDFLSWREQRHRRDDSAELRYWERFMGAKSDDDPALNDISPIKHVDKVTIPILLIHGRDDTVVPIAQSEDMRDALNKAGKPVEYLELPGEDHWLSRSETRLAMLKATAAFLETNNPSN